jgi:hypothetical protein
MNSRRRRHFFDVIMLSTLPHLVAVYVTYQAGAYMYTSLIASVTMASFLWHKSHETSKMFLGIDYSLAVVLVLYETYMARNKLVVLQINLALFLVNKTMDILSRYDILKYDIGHSVFHIISSYKTYYIVAYYTLDQLPSDFGD